MVLPAGVPQGSQANFSGSNQGGGNVTPFPGQQGQQQAPPQRIQGGPGQQSQWQGQQQQHQGLPHGDQGGQQTSQPDFSQIQDQLQTTQGQLNHAMEQMRALNDQNQQYKQTFDGLKGVFAPEEQNKGPSNVDRRNEFLDRTLQYELELQRQGQGMPITTGLVSEYTNFANQQEQQVGEMQQKIDALTQQINILRDPQMAIDNNAYMSIDHNFKSAIDLMYGPDNQQNQIQKQSVFSAATQEAGRRIKEMRQQNPQAWDYLRRNPQMQQQMVEEIVGGVIPPKAREIMAENHLQNTEMSTQELMQAFDEAGQIQDPRQRQAVRTNIRQKILEATYNRSAGRNDRLNEVYRPSY